MIRRTDKLYDIGELPELGVLPEKMHAWVLTQDSLGELPGAFHQEIVDVPEPKKGEVIVANMCAGVNFNGVWAALGRPKNVLAHDGIYGEEDLDFHICGSESAGIVYAVGEGVTKVKVGDRVTIGGGQYDPECPVIKAGEDPVCSPTFRVWGYEGNWGAFAQFSKVLELQCQPYPDVLSFEEAASFTATGIPICRMLTHWTENKVKPGDVVLIYGGSGGLGTIAIELVKYFGARPVAVVSDDEKGKFCMSLGAEGYLNRKKYDHWGKLKNYSDPEAQRRWTASAMKFKRDIWKIVGEKKSPAIVIEHPGSDTFPTSVFVCDTHGMVVTCGATTGYDADFDLRYLWMNQKRIQGSHSGTEEDYEVYWKAIVEGGVRPYIGKVFNWEELPAAHEALYKGTGPYGRMVINIGNTGRR